ncbi:hypothetical protein DVS28_b0055 (plasmid) [Euzebya pacifica]|uniref:Uncharacterized protein n=1 Tax=Euzebya pacifica TaxID=1608957 RepID=A0A346Y5S8_9ACTN|nr:hypothetical protein [Euzebya pacifica]AXV09825.1 hypothetical protein DVS28_b0055 [Euzebya pacifica]
MTTATATTDTDSAFDHVVEGYRMPSHGGTNGGNRGPDDFGRGGGGWGGGSGDDSEGEESGRVLWGIIGGILTVTVLAGFNPTIAAVAFLLGLAAVGIVTLIPAARR